MADKADLSAVPDMRADVVTQFFRDFEEGSNTFSAELVSGQFSDPFMTANPNGVTRAVSLADFVAGIGARRDLFQSIGFKDVRIQLLQQVRFDEHYVLAKTKSLMRFAKSANETVELESESTYVLLVKDDRPRIVFYTTHKDLTTILREHGLLPSD